MRENQSRDLLVEIYNFNQGNRLDFYAFVKVILEQSQCAIISKPYWPVVDGNPGGEVFTIFPDLECSVCDGRFKCQDIKGFTNHAIMCLASKDVLKGREDHEFYEKYGVVPKSVKAVVEKARTQRDHNAVCIAPVLDHPNVKELAELQRKEREKMTTEIANYEEALGPNGPILKLAKGSQMPLDRMVWIQTPLTSELATLLLAGMQPIRHSPTGIHLPIVFRDTGLTKVIHLHVDRFEELAAIRMAEQNWELMKVELQQVGFPDEGDLDNGPVAPCVPDVMTGDPKDSFKKIIGANLHPKQRDGLLTQFKTTQKVVKDLQSDFKKYNKEKASEAAAAKAASDNIADGTKHANGNHVVSRNHEASSSEQAGCSKFT